MNPIYFGEYNYSNKYSKKQNDLIYNLNMDNKNVIYDKYDIYELDDIEDSISQEDNSSHIIDILPDNNDILTIEHSCPEINFDSNYNQITIHPVDEIKTNNLDVDKVKIDNNLNKKNSISPFILNPLTVIIKLSILSCKPIGTKIHISNNIIYFQEPGIFQSLTRYIFNSNKYHLQYIYNPIKFACQKYLTQEFIQTNPNIINLFISAKNGIENLIKTYSTCPITVLCLKYYHVIISNSIKQTSNEFIFQEPVTNDNDDDTIDFYTKELLEKFENQWNTSKIKIILDLMDFLLNYDVSKNKINNIKSLETIVNNSDEETQKLLIVTNV